MIVFHYTTKDFILPSCMHRHSLAYIYGPLLRKALDEFKDKWNTHSIRRNKKAGCPSGVPDDLYKLPQLTGWLSGLNM